MRYFISGQTLSAGTWSHVAVVGDENRFRIYVNGELSMESDFQTTDGGNVEYLIGGLPDAGAYSGAVDDFAVFNVALENTEIKAIISKGVRGAFAVELGSKLVITWGALKSTF